MCCSNSSVRFGEFNPNMYHSHAPSKLKAYGFALATIMSMGSLAIAGVGLAAYFQVGMLSNLSQVSATIMMISALGGSGIVLFGVGLASSIENCQRLKDEEIIRSTQSGLVYGPEVWRICGIDVINQVPETPEIDWDAIDPHFQDTYRRNYVLLYLPNRVRINDEEHDLTLQIVKDRFGAFDHFDDHILEQYGECTSPGWVLMSKTVIPGSRNGDFETLETMLDDSHSRMPHALEAIVFSLMVYTFAGERLYGPSTFTRCIERLDTGRPVKVGHTNPTNGLEVSTSHFRFSSHYIGVAAARDMFVREEV